MTKTNKPFLGVKHYGLGLIDACVLHNNNIADEKFIAIMEQILKESPRDEFVSVTEEGIVMRNIRSGQDELWEWGTFKL